MIQVEQTPNPDSLKFLSQKILSKVGTEEFKKSDLNSIKIPFVREILNISGVELVLISDNFLTRFSNAFFSSDDGLLTFCC